jgi:hypothetical protein
MGGRFTVDCARLEYIASFAAVLMAIKIIGIYSAVSGFLLDAEITMVVLFLIYTYFYLTASGKIKPVRRNAEHMLAVLIFISFAAMFAAPGGADSYIVASASYNAISLGVVALYYVPLLALAFAAFYLYRHRRKGIGIALMVVLLLALIFYLYISSYPLDFFLNDETAIGFMSVNSLFHGINPYTAKFFSPLINNVTTVGITFTTNNSFIDTLGYPAAYMYANIPFYFLSHFNLANAAAIDFKAEAVSYIFLLMLVVYYLDKRNAGRGFIPNVYAMLFLVPVLIGALSMVTFLMLAVILMAYFKIDKWYAFLLLGFAAALQEELWIPVLLLIIYYFYARGMRKGLYISAGTVAVFTALNAYFIALGPLSFLSGMLSTLNTYIFPDSLAVFGYALLENVHVLLGAFSYIDLIAIALAAVVFAAVRDKRLIPLLSLLVFMFFDRSSWAYYAFFGFMFVFVLTVEDKRTRAKRRMKRTNRHAWAYAIAIALLVVLLLAVIVRSNSAYGRNFNLGVYNQTIYFSNNSTHYDSMLQYRGISNNSTVYMVMFGTLNNYTNLFGLMGYRFLQSPHYEPCNAFACSFNPNVFRLSGSGSEQLDVYVPNGRFTPFRVILYSKQYFYAAKAVYINGGG